MPVTKATFSSFDELEQWTAEERSKNNRPRHIHLVIDMERDERPSRTITDYKGPVEEERGTWKGKDGIAKAKPVTTLEQWKEALMSLKGIWEGHPEKEEEMSRIRKECNRLF
ncbi:hypothetical protein [Candidatus Thiosymbion oneisti]|uniref:hypothetical protein n=1 Tax=Candidatus Thiosymbion oneisti TaxID=589554 RepID=UPI00105E6C7E|nr:hypothetical protein [Candidatus Thiosymbion oneisti]